MKIHGIEIKPGMVLYGSKNGLYTTLIAIPYGANSISFIDFTEGGWYLYYESRIDVLEEIRDHPKNSDLMGGDILWKRSNEIVISIKEIAKKFKIPKDVKIIIKD